MINLDEIWDTLFRKLTNWLHIEGSMDIDTMDANKNNIYNHLPQEKLVSFDNIITEHHDTENLSSCSSGLKSKATASKKSNKQTDIPELTNPFIF